MHHTQTSYKSVQEIVQCIEKVASNYNFGVQHIYNLQETLQSKGKDLDNECQIVDICNANYAQTLLHHDLTLACVLPCKIAVYHQNNQTHVTLNDFTQLVGNINANITNIAAQAQENLLGIIHDAIKMAENE
jgi:uncharacterized protein (DUF302 family)